MGYYRTCPFCGANLDPEEKCDCRDRDTENENKEDKNNADPQ